MQITAQKTGYKKVVRLSANWAELKALCLQMKHYNFLKKKKKRERFLIWLLLLLWLWGYGCVESWQCDANLLCDTTCSSRRGGGGDEKQWKRGCLSAEDLMRAHTQFWNKQKKVWTIREIYRSIAFGISVASFFSKYSTPDRNKKCPRRIFIKLIYSQSYS